MIKFSNCKINLGLNILERLPNGYHKIETVFYPAPWKDVLEIVKADEFKFESEGIRIPGDSSENLCVKAFQLLKKDFDLSPVHIFLKKHLPIGAGLGGGSSNAAFAIKILNELFELNLGSEKMKSYATQLGADCSFFIENEPTYATGIGNEFEPINLKLQDKQILLCYPRKAINTNWAYAQINLKETKAATLKSKIEQPIETWKENVNNDFEKEVVKVLPEVKTLKNLFYENKADYAAMSGSGSTIFGVFPKEIDLNNLKEELLQQNGFKVFVDKL